MGLVVRILVGLSPSRKGWWPCICCDSDSDGDGCSSIITLGDGATWLARIPHVSSLESGSGARRAESGSGARHAGGPHLVAVVVHEGAEQLLPLLDALSGLLQLRGDFG